jgi:hypothetical protein
MKGAPVDIVKVIVGHLAELPAKLVAVLPEKLQPVAKSLVPVAAGAILALDDLTLEATEVDGLLALGTGAAVSALVWLFPNLKPGVAVVEVPEPDGAVTVQIARDPDLP